MRMILWTSSLAAILALGAAACSDDGGTDNADTSAPADTVGGDSAPGDTSVADTTPADTTPADPCDPNPCANPPADECNGDNSAVVSYASPGTCTDNSGTAACDYGSGTETACTGGDICSATTAECAAPGDPCDYVFDEKVSVLTELKIASLDSDNDPPSDHCCFDFNDDDVIDNKLGAIVGLLGTFVGDVNALIQEQIDGGSLLVLLETKGVDDLTTDSDFTINGFLGEDADTDASNNLTGNGEFEVDPLSFKDGTADPLISFGGASITGGVATAGPSLFQLSLPLFEGAPLQVAVRKTRIEAHVAAGTNGKGLAMTGDTGELGAKLGGVITLVDLFGAINAFIESSCVVVTDADNQLISNDGGTWKCAPATDPNVVDSTACEEGDPAVQLAGFCGAAVAFIQPDVDTNNDGDNDAISLGAWVNADSAVINGLTAEASCQ